MEFADKRRMLAWTHVEVFCFLNHQILPAVQCPLTVTLCTVCLQFQADFSELLGLKDYMGVMYLITLLEKVVPVSDERVKVTEETLDGVEVLLYQPRQPREDDAALRMAVIYLHGGGWCLGSSSELAAAAAGKCVSSKSFHQSAEFTQANLNC